MKSRIVSTIFPLILFIPLVFTSCSTEDDEYVVKPGRHWVEHTVAVVAPLGDEATNVRLKRTAEWFLDNFRQAQMYDTLAITLKLEWYDEDSSDLKKLSGELAQRDDVMAIIGPFSNEGVADFAPACQKVQKTLITPTATSEELLRRYAVSSTTGNKDVKPFLWALTENDVTFTETLMNTYAAICQYYPESKPYAALFAPNDIYGLTFYNWAPFFAQCYGIDLVLNRQYDNLDDLKSRFSPYVESITENRAATFCVVEYFDQLYRVAAMRRELIFSLYKSILIDPSDTEENALDPRYDREWQFFEYINRTYFAFPAISEEGLDKLGERAKKILEGYQGFAPYADPSTGFEQSYKNRFNVLPTFAECKFYDALMISAFAACYVEHFPQDKNDEVAPNDNTANAFFNNAIATLTSVKQNDIQTLSGAAWAPASMEIYLAALERGTLLHFMGASGDIAFDTDTYTTSTETTYVHWQILNGKILHRGYFGGSSERTDEVGAAWRYLYDQKSAEEDFKSLAADNVSIVYPDLTDQYAVLVQGSKGFYNYRHQADVLNMYQLLRKGGFDDDHIILILDGSLNNEKDNPEPGVVRASIDGPDLMGGTTPGSGMVKAVVDYDAASLSPRDISDILLGRKSEHLPVVLTGDVETNVFFYWSGHGTSKETKGYNEFDWRDNAYGSGFTDNLMEETVKEMRRQDRFRKMFIVAEPCYSEAVLKPLVGVPGVLAMTGASAQEQSWADNWNNDYLFWMCDRFTKNFITCLTEDPDMNYHDIFLYCALHTLGSHAKLLNAENFDNLYISTPKEFLVK